ncbi:hypothetical protein [Brachybacterium sacelli]|uniref:Uncharacterized protein n=1 Tax=Brachybacterium sacelli TaxID=173364 RepID=A0ABS4X801_9MICO|nr:hypothetical protein [Brachybacterium sacelli]MBP2384431.1 hypothetical protein [Brachybacterium sacelli]
MLWPTLQRDFLLSLAVEGTYRPLRSSAILDELVHHEAQKLIRRGTPDADAEARSDRLIATMPKASNACPHCSLDIRRTPACIGRHEQR